MQVQVQTGAGAGAGIGTGTGIGTGANIGAGKESRRITGADYSQIRIQGTGTTPQYPIEAN